MNDDWHATAACRGRWDLFYGPAGERPEPRAYRESRAAQVCAACPHTGPEGPCWAEELADVWKADGIHGYRAGMTEDQRRARYRALPRTGRGGAWYYDLVPA